MKIQISSETYRVISSSGDTAHLLHDGKSFTCKIDLLYDRLTLFESTLKEVIAGTSLFDSLLKYPIQELMEMRSHGVHKWAKRLKSFKKGVYLETHQEWLIDINTAIQNKIN